VRYAFTYFGGAEGSPWMEKGGASESRFEVVFLLNGWFFQSTQTLPLHQVREGLKVLGVFNRKNHFSGSLTFVFFNSILLTMLFPARNPFLKAGFTLRGPSPI
jgi:hypothetical protein